MAEDIVLRAEALKKNFGKLEVTRDVALALPRGARHALIGPNGAGKTTLINLLTGQLKPDAGRIELEGGDITSLAPAHRVRRGLSRTFQINTLFPDLTPIEAVTLAVMERERSAGQFWKRRSAQSDAIEESFTILTQLGLADVVVMLILGGTGRLYGAILGTIIFLVARDQLAGINPQYWYFGIGILLMVVVLFMPKGILGFLARIVDRSK